VTSASVCCRYGGQLHHRMARMAGESRVSVNDRQLNLPRSQLSILPSDRKSNSCSMATTVLTKPIFVSSMLSVKACIVHEYSGPSRLVRYFYRPTERNTRRQDIFAVITVTHPPRISALHLSLYCCIFWQL